MSMNNISDRFSVDILRLLIEASSVESNKRRILLKSDLTALANSRNAHVPGEIGNKRSILHVGYPCKAKVGS